MMEIKKENFVLNKKNFRKNFDEIFIKEVYKEADISENEVWLDAGGFIGLFSAYVRNKKAKSYCYEPISQLFDIAKINLQGVNVYQKGIWDKNTTLNIGVSHQSLMSSSIFKPNLKTQEEIEIIDINSVLDEHSDINCLKLDVEGCEYEILKAINFEKRKIDKIVCEYHFKHRDKIVMMQEYREIYNKLKENFNDCINLTYPDKLEKQFTKILSNPKSEYLFNFMSTLIFICKNKQE